MAAPGISDNGTRSGARLALARAVQFAHIKPQRTIFFRRRRLAKKARQSRGMRGDVDTIAGNSKRFVVLDGSGTDHVTTKRWLHAARALITGPGGHSWSDFGMPNPIQCTRRGSVRFINTKVRPALAQHSTSARSKGHVR